MKWIHFRSTLFSGCFVNLCFFSHFLQWGIFLCGQGWTNRNTFTIFHINLLVKTRALLHDLHAWTQNPSPGPAIFRFKSFKQAQVFISSSIFPKHVSLKALGQQRNSAEHKDVFVTTSTRPKADHLQQTLQIASPPGVVPLEPPISASWLSSTDSKNASFSFVTLFSPLSAICCWELPETQLWHRSIWIQKFGSVPSRLSSPSISSALYQVCTFFTALFVAMASNAKFQCNSFGRLDRILDFPSFRFVYAPGLCSALPYHHPKLLPEQESTAFSGPSTCTRSSSRSLAWRISAEKQWMDSPSSQVILKSRRSGKEQMGLALSREKGGFWQGSYKGTVLSVCVKLRKGAYGRERSRICCLIAMETAKEPAGRI